MLDDDTAADEADTGRDVGRDAGDVDLHVGRVVGDERVERADRHGTEQRRPECQEEMGAESGVLTGRLTLQPDERAEHRRQRQPQHDVVPLQRLHHDHPRRRLCVCVGVRTHRPVRIPTQTGSRRSATPDSGSRRRTLASVRRLCRSSAAPVSPNSDANGMGRGAGWPWDGRGCRRRCGGGRGRRRGSRRRRRARGRRRAGCGRTPQPP